MADFLCADFDEDDFDTDCAPGPSPGQTTHVKRSPRYGVTRMALLGLVLWLKK